MLFDSYRYSINNPSYKRVLGEGFLIVELKCPIEENTFKSWSECHYISYVLSGKKKWITHGKEWELGSGESVFVKKGAYLNQQYFDGDYCVLDFYMTDDFMRKCVKEDMDFYDTVSSDVKNLGPIFKVHVTESLEVLYESFFAYLKVTGQVPLKIIELKFRELLINILMDPRNRKLCNFIIDLANNKETKISSVMEDNFNFNLAIEEYARLCGKSLSSFKRVFKEIYKTSPGRWLKQRRLEYAKELLKETNQTIQEICFECGFENTSHFTRAFKETIGETPHEYRFKKVDAD